MGVYLYMSTLWWTGGLLGHTQPLADRRLHVVTLGRACSSGDDSIYFLPRKDCHMRQTSSWKVLCAAKDKHHENEHLIWLWWQHSSGSVSKRWWFISLESWAVVIIKVRINPSSRNPRWIAVSPSKDSGRNEQWILINIRQINIRASINDCVCCKMMVCNLYCLCFYLFLVIYAWAANMV